MTTGKLPATPAMALSPFSHPQHQQWRWTSGSTF